MWRTQKAWVKAIGHEHLCPYIVATRRHFAKQAAWAGVPAADEIIEIWVAGCVVPDAGVEVLVRLYGHIAAN